MRPLPAGETRTAEESAFTLNGRVCPLIAGHSIARCFLGAALVLVTIELPACTGVPPLAVQKQSISKNELPLHQLSPQAFQEAWGAASFTHRERMQFFEMPDGSLIPRFRVPLGESPEGWDGDLAGGMALLLAYADRGWLLGFLDDRLVYREQLPLEQLRALGTQWKREAEFKTRLERPSSSHSPFPR